MKKFYSGILFYSAIQSLIQDNIGKEAYIQYVQDNWVDATITVPIAIVFLLASLAFYIYKE